MHDDFAVICSVLSLYFAYLDWLALCSFRRLIDISSDVSYSFCNWSFHSRTVVMSSLGTRLGEHAALVARTAQHQYSKAKTELYKTFNVAKLSPKAILYTGLVFVTCIWLTLAFTRHVRNTRRKNRANNSNNNEPSTPNLEKRSPFRAPDRPFGGK